VTTPLGLAIPARVGAMSTSQLLVAGGEEEAILPLNFSLSKKILVGKRFQKHNLGAGNPFPIGWSLRFLRSLRSLRWLETTLYCSAEPIISTLPQQPLRLYVILWTIAAPWLIASFVCVCVDNDTHYLAD